MARNTDCTYELDRSYSVFCRRGHDRFFVQRDALNFGVMQMLVAVILITVVVSTVALLSTYAADDELADSLFSLKEPKFRSLRGFARNRATIGLPGGESPASDLPAASSHFSAFWKNISLPFIGKQVH